MPRLILKLRNQFLDVWQLTFRDFGILTSQSVISTISRVVKRVDLTGTVSGCLRSSAPHVRSVPKDYMIRQRHVSNRVLKAQGASTFAIVNPEWPIRRDKVTNRFRVNRIQYQPTSDLRGGIKKFVH